MTEPITYSLDSIPLIAKKLKQLVNDGDVITFTGPLGAGKTTMIKELLRQFGIAVIVTSPTFAYMNRYKNKNGLTFYHFDLYRIESQEQFLESGFDEYLYQPNSITLIEWPEPIMPLLKKNVVHVSIDYEPEPDMRRIVID